jgi:Uncharacterized protein conserved in bacteria
MLQQSPLKTKTHPHNNNQTAHKKKKGEGREGPGLDNPRKRADNKKNEPAETTDQKDNERKTQEDKKKSGRTQRAQQKKSRPATTRETENRAPNSTKFLRPIAKMVSGRLLNKKKCNLNWCKVETGEYKGWVLKENLWGLN